MDESDSIGLPVQFFGHACLKLEAGENSAIMDPWLSEKGAFFRSWFQFPENAHLYGRAFSGVKRILVSHNHEDHFDPVTLRRALKEDPARTLHIPKYQSDWFEARARRALGELQGRLHTHRPLEPFEAAPGVNAFFAPELSPAQIDSAIVLFNQQASLVNLNDSRLSSDQLLDIKKRVPPVGLLALQASGASEYPVNYTYGRKEKLRRSVEKRQLKFEHCLNIIDLLEPKRVLFFAGPPVFLDPAIQKYNDDAATSIFPDQKQIIDSLLKKRPDLAGKTLFLMPGEEARDERLWDKISFDDARYEPYTQKGKYVGQYHQRRETLFSPAIGAAPGPEEMLEHFASMPRLSEYVSEGIGGKIGFKIEEAGEYTVDFTAKTAQKKLAPDCDYVLTVPAACMQAILSGEHTWDDAFLSMRMTFEERTDKFSPHLKLLLRFMDARLFGLYEEYEKNLREHPAGAEMFEVEQGGARYRLQKSCPHAGVDLSKNGKVNDDGTITCMAHRFCFDMATGKCVNTKGFQLKVEPAKKKQSA